MHHARARAEHTSSERNGSGHPAGCVGLCSVPPPSGAMRPMAESWAHCPPPGSPGALELGQHHVLTREELTPWLEDKEAFARGAPSGEGRCGVVNFCGNMWWVSVFFSRCRESIPFCQSFPSYVFMSPVQPPLQKGELQGTALSMANFTSPLPHSAFLLPALSVL